MNTLPLNILICTQHVDYGICLKNAINSFSKKYRVVNSINHISNASAVLDKFYIEYLLIRLPSGIENAFEFMTNLKKTFPLIKIIILTLFDHKYYNEKLKWFGASDYYLIYEKLDNLIIKLDQIQLLANSYQLQKNES